MNDSYDDDDDDNDGCDNFGDDDDDVPTKNALPVDEDNR